jgi:hypothetical protein
MEALRDWEGRGDSTLMNKPTLLLTIPEAAAHCV